jgi:lipoprotein-anchoring transpeptidase ErfK/SrfK
MRRLVVVSNKKSKAIAASVAALLSLTSIHLAAAARMESLRLQQEQLEQASTNIARLSLSQSSLALTPMPNRQTNASSQAQVESTASNPQKAEIKSPAFPASATGHNRQIVISIADRQLAVLDNGQVIKIYPIAVGTRSTPSPDGDFVIINHAKDPTYRHADVEIGPGKDNPLGSRWMGLSMKGYGIHGTNVQSSIGKAASHGCFRMRKHDVEELYSLVQVGDTVTVRRERDEMIAQVFAAPVFARPATLATTNVLSAKTQSGGDVQMASASETATVETSAQ